MAHLVTVTGATGHVGRVVAEELLRGGVKVRAVARSEAGLAALARQGAEAHAGDLGDARFLAGAFRGADAVFAMVPQHLDAADYPADQLRMVAGLVAALSDAGVRRVVALSTPVAQARVGLPAALAEFEDRLASLPGVSVVALQPMYYMENFLASIPMIRGAGILGGAVRGDVALPMIATRDVAAVAVPCLQSPEFHGFARRPLLGPRDYTFREAGTLLGTAIGKPDLPYLDLPRGDVRGALLGAGFSPSAVDAFLDMTDTLNDGRVQGGLRRDASSRTPTTFEDFAREVFAPAWRATAGEEK